MASKSTSLRHSVLVAVHRLQREAEAPGALTAVELAERHINSCRSTEDRAGIRFWRLVWTHLILVRHGTSDITVLPGDDDYPPEPAATDRGQSAERP